MGDSLKRPSKILYTTTILSVDTLNYVHSYLAYLDPSVNSNTESTHLMCAQLKWKRPARKILEFLELWISSITLLKKIVCACQLWQSFWLLIRITAANRCWISQIKNGIKLLINRHFEKRWKLNWPQEF